MSHNSASPNSLPSLENLHEFHLRLAGREWTIRHAGIILSYEDEQAYLKALREKNNRVPYGLALWPSAIALAHDLAARAEASELQGKRILELGAGTGLPGIVAATVGKPAAVIQTDNTEAALLLCRQNGERNGASGIVYRLADWTDENKTDEYAPYDLILGSDVLYAEPMHPHLKRLFADRLARGGTILLADPFRGPSLRFLEAMEQEGWTVRFSKWNLGEETTPRPVGVFQLRH